MSKAKEVINLVEGNKVQWKENNKGSGMWSADVESRLGTQVHLSANDYMSKVGGKDKRIVNWIVGRGGRIFGDGRAKDLADAKKQAEKFLAGMETRGIA